MADSEELSLLLAHPGKNEIECRKYLDGALDLLVPYTGSVTMVNPTAEYPGASGPSDLIILCDRIEHGISIRSAYIWEIKAPQEKLFVRCNSNRVRPSEGLNKAENQLLHYYDDCKNEQFRASFNITDLDEIHVGGILIGQRSTLVSGNMNKDVKSRLYGKAIRIRKAQLYRSCGLKIFLWDDIVEYLKVPDPEGSNQVTSTANSATESTVASQT